MNAMNNGLTGLTGDQEIERLAVRSAQAATSEFDPRSRQMALGRAQST
jgi:hypothetical protein